MMRVTGILKMLLLAGVLGAVPAMPSVGQNVRPPDLKAQYHRAETAWKSGSSMLEAKARVDRVLTELPDDVDALKLRARVLLAMDRVDEGLADARRAVKLTPEDGEAHLILCEAARRAGHPALAERALDAAAALVIEDAALHVQLSRNAMLLGKLDEAVAFARIAMASDPQEAAAYYQLARVFVMENLNDEAATVLAGGLHNAILDPRVIAVDTTLVRLAGHPELRSWMGH